jgi:hypothetical protein
MKIIAVYALVTVTIMGFLPKNSIANNLEQSVASVDLTMGIGRSIPSIVYQAAGSTELASLRSNEIRKVKYGVYSSLKAVETNRVLDEWQTKANSLSPTMYAVDLLSKNKRKELGLNNGSSNVDWDWYNSRANSLKISILRPPLHAQLGDLKANRSLAIVPNTDHLGKDRVDVLVEGKDDLGRPFKLTLRYYLTVLNKAEEQRICGGKDLPFKELCGKNHNRWRISGHEQEESALALTQ